MKKLTLRQVLRAIVIIWIANAALEFYAGVIQQIDVVTSEYISIDPLQSESPDIPILGGHVTINQTTISESPDMVRKLAIRGSILRHLSWFLGRLLTVLVLLNIFQLLKTWNFSHFFIQENAKIIRRISWIYLGWIVVYFLIYQSAAFLFPPDYIVDYYNVATLNLIFQHLDGISGLIESFRRIGESIDNEALIVFFLLFVLSITMKKGTELQEEADLTI